MRSVFIGASDLTLSTAQQLLKSGHEVVIIERDKARIEELSTEIGSGFIHGDGSKPAILREADPAATDFLFCLTDNDQNNILASLVGRSLGYPRVVTRIQDPSYEHICIELGLTDVIVPNYTIARYLADMCAGQNPLELSALIKADARIFSFVAREQDEGLLSELKLPENSRVIFFYRNEKFMLPETNTALQKGDEVVIIAHRKALPALESHWAPMPTEIPTPDKS
ncbi:MAG: TrkA family potassium uptake protein [Gammaproteobacteria bacterium]|nr:TrkA family potassium uptake protein [Gammaproteobacteria bacterium]